VATKSNQDDAHTTVDDQASIHTENIDQDDSVTTKDNKVGVHTTKIVLLHATQVGQDESVSGDQHAAKADQDDSDAAKADHNNVATDQDDVATAKDNQDDSATTKADQDDIATTRDDLEDSVATKVDQDDVATTKDDQDNLGTTKTDQDDIADQDDSVISVTIKVDQDDIATTTDQSDVATTKDDQVTTKIDQDDVDTTKDEKTRKDEQDNVVTTKDDTKDDLFLDVVDEDAANVGLDSTTACVSDNKSVELVDTEISINGETTEQLDQNIPLSKAKLNEYLASKGFYYQVSCEEAKCPTGIEKALQDYTALDILDEDNKFICQNCTQKRKANKNVYVAVVLKHFILVCNILSWCMCKQYTQNYRHNCT